MPGSRLIYELEFALRAGRRERQNRRRSPGAAKIQDLRRSQRDKEAQEREQSASHLAYPQTPVYTGEATLALMRTNAGRFAADYAYLMTKAIDPNLNTTVYEYDEDSQLVAVTDAQQNTTTLTYN